MLNSRIHKNYPAKTVPVVDLPAVDINPDVLAVTTSAKKVPSFWGADARNRTLRNRTGSASSVYVHFRKGAAAVEADPDAGVELPADQSLPLPVRADIDIFVICASGTATVDYLEYM